ncbi:hypothetical protein EDD16DRAFT_1902612 [Pisolithus croceorrhizus]|nr:hypothetical protein EDD16DRAFT_1902612 [Pisolithus croceorrhizus]KAI6105977.1 hypothetical protein EV401DRAFT_2274339 [Pisolithus croceorrhizus]KAI6137590.1 hypothetical protein EDD17DRAFT_1881808 [Pisolithus thermaeus]
MSLLALPFELIERVAIHLTDANGIQALLPLLLTCKHLYGILGTQSNHHIFASHFASHYDFSSASRRLGPQAAKSRSYASQLLRYSHALSRIRSGNIHADDVVHTFWTSFLMFMEDDGKNRASLEAAGLPDFVDRFVRERLYDGHRNGWPADNAVNSLALWLLWLTTTEDRLRAESSPRRAQMIKLMLPFVAMPVRYPSTLAPDIHFSLPLSRDVNTAPHSVPTLHGPYPHYLDDRCHSTALYSISNLEIGIPLASIAAKLIYISRREVFPVGVPSHLPRDRQHAFQLGLTTIGPTQEDVHELNANKVAKLVPPTRPDGNWSESIQGWDTMAADQRAAKAPSARWDNDWYRLVDCTDIFRPISLKRSHYTPGTMSGLWQGRMLIVDDTALETLLQIPHMPTNFNEQNLGVVAAPVFMRLREYVCMDVDPNEPVPAGEMEDGRHNAWLPASTQRFEYANELALSYSTPDPAVPHRRIEKTKRYHEYIPDGSLHDETTCRGCLYRGTSEMVFREHDACFLEMLDDELAAAPLPDEMEGVEDADAAEDEEAGDDVDDDAMSVDDEDELIVKRKCDGIMDIVLVGETDERHAQAWHPYRFYGRVREWDGLIALVRAPAMPGAPHVGLWMFTGYVVGGQTLVGNWRTTSHPGEPVTFEGAFAMSKRD